MANINTDTPQSMTQQASNRLVGEEEVDIEFLEDDDETENENETAATTATAATGNSKKRKAAALRSPMWNYFTPEYLEEGDVLAIPISTVASESAFSTGGRILDDFRSSLNPDMVEALICAEDWLRNNKMDLVDAEDVPEEELEKEYESVLRSIVTDGARSAESGIAGTHLASKS